MAEATDRDVEIQMVDVPEREKEDLVITVNREPERIRDDSPSWAEWVAQAEHTPSHSDESFRPAYPNHLRSEIMAFDGELPIPPFMRFGPFLFRIFYPDQPRVCWKCGSPEHIGRSCPYHYCFSCDQSGHLAHACEERLKCSLCKAEDHLTIDCPGNWGRRTHAQRNPRRTEEPPEDPEELPQQDQEEESIEYDEASQQQSNDSEASSDDRSDDMYEEEGVSDIEQFSTSEDSNISPPQRKRGARPEANVEKKSRTEDPFPIDTFKVATLNVRGLNSDKLTWLSELSRREHLDFLCVQETLVSDDHRPEALAPQWDGPSFWSLAIGRRGGVVTLCSPGQRENVSTWQKDPEGRLLSLLISANGMKVNLVNMYAPTNPTERGVFLQSLQPYLFPNSHLLLAGDFNCYDGALDKMGGLVSTDARFSDLKLNQFIS